MDAGEKEWIKERLDKLEEAQANTEKSFLQFYKDFSERLSSKIDKKELDKMVAKIEDYKGKLEEYLKEMHDVALEVKGHVEAHKNISDRMWIVLGPIISGVVVGLVLFLVLGG